MKTYNKPTISIVSMSNDTIMTCSCGCFNRTDESGTHHANCDCPSCEDNGYSQDI